MAPSGEDRVGGRYELLRRIARGGGGTVWRAHDHMLDRVVALKQVEIATDASLGAPDDASAPGDGEGVSTTLGNGQSTRDRDRVRQRVLQEGRAAARLEHPAAVSVYDVIDGDGIVHLVMEFVEAPTLDAVLDRRGPLGDDEAATLGLGLLEVLEAAHERGIVHRDLKPSNVFVLPDGGVKLSDFGIAWVADQSSLTRTGAAMGSPSFIAPEQAQGHPTSPAVDLWGLGATLYTAVEGVPPFERAGVIPTVHAVVHDEPRHPQLAAALVPALGRLLDKDPEARAGGAWLREELRAVAAGRTVVAIRPDAPATSPARTTAAAAPPPSSPAPSAPPPEADTTTGASDTEADTGERIDPDAAEGAGGYVAAPEPDVVPPTRSDGERRRSSFWRAAALGGAAIAAIAAVVLGVVALGPGADQDAPQAGSEQPDTGSGGEPGDAEGGSDGADDADDNGTDDSGADDEAPREDGEGPDENEGSNDDGQDEPEDEAGGDAIEGSDDDGQDEPEDEAGGDAIEEPGEVPEDWQTVAGETYEVAVPPGWERRAASGNRTDYVDPETGSYLRVDWTNDPADDPVADWEQASAAFAQEFADYQELRIEPRTYRGSEAALWEYTYTDGGTPLHAYNFNILASDERAYALNLQSSEDGWEELEEDFPAFTAGFQPT